jgi:UTP--glucose-1-phosphate uridylyltransferase
MQVKKAVITAAARGERLFPVADTVQKAMLPMVDTDGINKPLIQIVAEEAFQSGIEEICVVCAPGDEERYREHFKALYNSLQQSFKNSDWAHTQLGKINDLLARLSFIVQEQPMGYGHAVYKSRQFVNGEPFLLMLGDYLYVSDLAEKHCARQLIDIAALEECSVSAVNPTIEHQISKYGTLTGKSLLNNKGVYQIEKIIEKPSVSIAETELQTPGLRAGYYLCFFGMHVFKSSIFDLLEDSIRSTNKGDSILLTPVLQKLAESDKYLALEMKGTRYDTSKKLGLMEAQIALGLAGNFRDEILSSVIHIMTESGKCKSN